MAALALDLRVRVRNASRVKVGLWALSLIARWMDAKTLERRINRMLGHLVAEMKMGNRPWQRLKGFCLEAKVEEVEPKDGWRMF